MYINYSTFRRLYMEATDSNNLSMYIMERGWQDWMGDEDNADNIVTLLTEIYNAAHSDFRHLRGKLGLTQSGMSAAYGISRRTVQEWESGDHAPSPFAECLLTYAILMELLNTKEDEDELEE